jgi:hypothetical protein
MLAGHPATATNHQPPITLPPISALPALPAIPALSACAAGRCRSLSFAAISRPWHGSGYLDRPELPKRVC